MSWISNRTFRPNSRPTKGWSTIWAIVCFVCSYTDISMINDESFGELAGVGGSAVTIVDRDRELFELIEKLNIIS